MRVIIVTICQKPLDITHVFSLIIFIGLCGPVELLIVHSYVTKLVGLSVDCEPHVKSAITSSLDSAQIPDFNKELKYL